MLLLPRVSFRCRRFRYSHETAIELKVLLANEKLMFHSYLLWGHGPKGIVRLRVGSVEHVLSAGAIEEDDDKLGQAVTNMPLTSLKRVVGKQSLKRAQAGMPSVRSIKIALCIEASAIRLTYFGRLVHHQTNP
jgi:hypothetical protein